jgi:hypothetical protein
MLTEIDVEFMSGVAIAVVDQRPAAEGLDVR